MNDFKHLHPIISFSYFFCVILFSFMMKHPLYLLVICLTTLCLHKLLDGGKALKKSVFYYALLSLFVMILNPIFSSRGATILGYVFDHQVTLESIVYGVLLAVALFNVLILFKAYELVITPEKFLYLFGTMLPKLTFMIHVSIRFVPVFQRRLKEIMDIQKTQGAFQQDTTRRQKMKEGMETLRTLITWSLESSLQTASSMRARGYGIGKRSSAVHYVMDSRDGLVGICMSFLLVIVMCGYVYGLGTYDPYPQLQPLHLSALFLLHLLCFCLFLCIPIFVLLKERLLWHYIRSKM
ncbi:energy-coupling factor transporter transmembrane component T [Longirhabdus pacifica]|uniref:energy-coupling factor transporter transmembrane component T n=1 Tax=Longirhabdus pacifica TaxID=2305227 RepID=UPI0013E8B991|nr:energy-coupling factor transporter transmembrane component T [Longirhabdus pacifica]